MAKANSNYYKYIPRHWAEVKPSVTVFQWKKVKCLTPLPYFPTPMKPSNWTLKPRTTIIDRQLTHTIKTTEVRYRFLIFSVGKKDLLMLK